MILRKDRYPDPISWIFLLCLLSYGAVIKKKKKKTRFKSTVGTITADHGVKKTKAKCFLLYAKLNHSNRMHAHVTRDKAAFQLSFIYLQWGSYTVSGLLCFMLVWNHTTTRAQPLEVCSQPGSILSLQGTAHEHTWLTLWSSRCCFESLCIVSMCVSVCTWTCVWVCCGLVSAADLWPYWVIWVQYYFA